MSLKPVEAHDSEDELRDLLINSVRDYAIFSLDPGGFVMSWNPGAQLLKGYSKPEIIGQHFSRFYTQEDRARGLPARALSTAISQGRFENEGWRIRKDGSRFWALVLISPMYDSAGIHKGFAKVTRDLSERRQAEDNRLRIAQLGEAARVRDEFLAYVSHELRGPLAAIQLQLQLLREQGGEISPERFDEIIGRLSRGYSRLAELVDSVLQQSRIQAGRPPTKSNPVDLRQTLVDLIEESRPQAERKGLHLRLSDSLEQHVVSTDHGALRVILQNLIFNAIKFSSRGTIDVRVVAAGPEYRISVCDEGPGILPEEQERIFEPFERIESLTHKHTPGFGLGLATCKRLSEALGGRIELSSSSNAGSTFTLVLVRPSPIEMP